MVVDRQSIALDLGLDRVRAGLVDDDAEERLGGAPLGNIDALAGQAVAIERQADPQRRVLGIAEGCDPDDEVQRLADGGVVAGDHNVLDRQVGGVRTGRTQVLDQNVDLEVLESRKLFAQRGAQDGLGRIEERVLLQVREEAQLDLAGARSGGVLFDDAQGLAECSGQVEAFVGRRERSDHRARLVGRRPGDEARRGTGVNDVDAIARRAIELVDDAQGTSADAFEQALGLVRPTRRSGAVQDQHHVATRLGQRGQGAGASDERAADRQRQERDRGHAQQQEQQVLELHATARLLVRGQHELHRRPTHGLVPLAVEQVDQDRHGHEGHAGEQRGIDEALEHQRLLPPRARAVRRAR